MNLNHEDNQKFPPVSLAVASALRDGRFNAPRNNTNTNEKRSFASAPTRSRVGTK